MGGRTRSREQRSVFDSPKSAEHNDPADSEADDGAKGRDQNEVGIEKKNIGENSDDRARHAENVEP